MATSSRNLLFESESTLRPRQAYSAHFVWRFPAHESYFQPGRRTPWVGECPAMVFHAHFTGDLGAVLGVELGWQHMTHEAAMDY